jgi:hypothetical protein
MTESDGDVGFVPLEADEAVIRGQLDIESREPGRQRGKTVSKEADRQRWRGVDPDEAARLIVDITIQDLRGPIHVASRLKNARTSGRKDVPLGPALKQLLSQARFQRAKPTRDRRVVNRHRARCGGQAAMAGKHQEYTNILPVEVCAFSISH